MEHVPHYHAPETISELLRNLDLASASDAGGESLIMKTHQYFSRYGVDPELSKHFTEVPFGTVLKETGKALHPTTHRNSLHIRNISKGVNKSLPFPFLVRSYTEPKFASNMENRHRERALMTSMLIAIDDDPDLWCTFNPKNLIKYYQYSEKDAKVFYKNITHHNLTYTNEGRVSLKMPKDKGFTPITIPVFTCNSGKDVTYIWSTSYNKQKESFINQDDLINSEIVNDIKESSVPDISQQVWRKVAQEHHNRNNPDIPWDNLSTNSQKRKLVNTIRHNSFGYVDYWLHRDKADMQKAHDEIFVDVMLKIMNKYPYVAEECRKQLNERDL